MTLVAIAELGGHKHLARHAGCPESGAHLPLVEVCRGTVYVAIAQLQGLLNRLLRPLARNLEGAKPHLGNHRAV